MTSPDITHMLAELETLAECPPGRPFTPMTFEYLERIMQRNQRLAGLDATIGHLVDRINARDAAVNARLAEVERRLSDHDMRLCDHDGRIVKAQRKADGHG